VETDAELLLRYARDRAEDAFAELVRRHIDFVFQTALHQVGGDAHHTSDVAQYVFAEVARRAASLAQHRVLKGWLFTTACHAAANIVRSEQRRRRREEEAHVMQTIANETEPPADWSEARPVINDALAALSARDREAVLLRYFEGRDYAEIGARFSLTADAARLRVDRALEKMRSVLARAGVTSGTAALANTLTAQAALSAPSSLAASVTATALASGPAAGGMATFLILMNTTKIQGALIAAVLLTGSVGLLLQQRSQAKLTDELAGLRTASVQRVKLRIENTQLAPHVTDLPDPLDGELAAARNAADELKRRLAEQPAAPLSPLLVPTAAWKNAGQATPGEAFETLQWARSAIDLRALGKLMAFAPGDRAKAEDVFSRLSAEVRVKLDLTSPEELAGFMCAMIEPSAGAMVNSATKQGDNDVEVRAEIQRLDGRSDSPRMQFHHAADGWRWVIPTNELHHGLNEIGHEFIPGFIALEGKK
jgi:RNA polymerase sigma factor (sigma-70 family)